MFYFKSHSFGEAVCYEEVCGDVSGSEVSDILFSVGVFTKSGKIDVSSLCKELQTLEAIRAAVAGWIGVDMYEGVVYFELSISLEEALFAMPPRELVRGLFVTSASVRRATKEVLERRRASV